jgi:hypothetical protein
MLITATLIVHQPAPMVSVKVEKITLIAQMIALRCAETLCAKVVRILVPVKVTALPVVMRPVILVRHI